MIFSSNKHSKSRFLYVFIALVVLVFSIFFIYRARASENFNYSINVNYNVASDGITSVKETYNITNKSESQYLDSIKVTTPGVNIDNIKVYYTSGASIPFDTNQTTKQSGGYDYDYTEITINFNRANAGQGLQWGFVIQYDTSDIVENKGRANVVYIPGISPENRDQYNVELTVPSSFGGINGFGKLPKLISEDTQSRSYSFSKEELLSNSVQLLFGDSTTYRANFVYPLNNTSNLASDFEITLPPSTATQTTYIEKINPEPISTRVDGDGNVIAKYRLESGQNIKVVADILADVKYVKYDLSNSGTINDIPQELKNKYTKPTKYWQSDDPSIKKKALELTSDKKNVAEKVSAINDYVIKSLNYNNEKIKYNIRQGSLAAFNNPNNVVCLEYSDLTIALLRAASIPARMPVGYAYSGDLKKTPEVADSLHSWVQAYIPNNGWINMDPTWGEKFNNFGISDIDHMDFAIWGEEDSEPVAVEANGRDTNYQYENVKITYTSAKPEPAKDSKISAKNWVILPFFSITTYDVSGPSNATVFNPTVELENKTDKKQKPIGTIAPSQQKSGNFINLGLAFASYSQISLLDIPINRNLANSTVTNDYLPMIAIFLTISVIIVTIVIIIQRRKIELKEAREYEAKKE